jgi:hypothetical protein
MRFIERLRAEQLAQAQSSSLTFLAKSASDHLHNWCFVFASVARHGTFIRRDCEQPSNKIHQLSASNADGIRILRA